MNGTFACYFGVQVPPIGYQGNGGPHLYVLVVDEERPNRIVEWAKPLGERHPWEAVFRAVGWLVEHEAKVDAGKRCPRCSNQEPFDEEDFLARASLAMGSDAGR